MPMTTAMTLGILLAGSLGAAEPPVNRYANAAAVVGDRVVIVGGTIAGDAEHRLTQVTEILDTRTGEWQRGTDMPTARDFACAVSVGGKVIAIGGLIDGRRPSDATEMYDPVEDRWTILPALPTARNRMGACVIDGQVYVAGGIGLVDAADDITMTTLERFDPATRTWERLADMQHGRHGHVVVAREGEVWVIGGYAPDMTDNVEIYNPGTDSWRDGPALSEPRGFPVGAVVGDRIVVINSRSKAARTSTIYEDGAWRAGPAVPDDRHRCGVGVVGGRIYLVSGDVSGQAYPTPHTIWLDVDTGEWGTPGP